MPTVDHSKYRKPNLTLNNFRNQSPAQLSQFLRQYGIEFPPISPLTFLKLNGNDLIRMGFKRLGDRQLILSFINQIENIINPPTYEDIYRMNDAETKIQYRYGSRKVVSATDNKVMLVKGKTNKGNTVALSKKLDNMKGNQVSKRKRSDDFIDVIDQNADIEDDNPEMNSTNENLENKRNAKDWSHREIDATDCEQESFVDSRDLALNAHSAEVEIIDSDQVVNLRDSQQQQMQEIDPPFFGASPRQQEDAIVIEDDIVLPATKNKEDDIIDLTLDQDDDVILIADDDPPVSKKICKLFPAGRKNIKPTKPEDSKFKKARKERERKEKELETRASKYLLL